MNSPNFEIETLEERIAPSGFQGDHGDDGPDEADGQNNDVDDGEQDG